MTTPTAIRDLARTHLLPHFTRGSLWYDEKFPLIVGGEGAYVYDEDGTRYLDGLSGLFCVNMGHGRRDIAAAAIAQMEQLAYWTNWSSAHPTAVELATLISDLAPDDLGTVFFVNSGSEAVESAIKFVRQYHRSQGHAERVKIIARDLAYHGTTMGALAVTGIPRIRDAFGPLMPGVRHIPHTRGEVLLPGQPAAELPSVQALLRVIEEEGPHTIAAIFAEPVQNSGGALVPPDGYWQELRSICDRFGILLVADEVICAFGRLGEWFGSAKYGVTPDLITFAKGVTSGYGPLGGVIIRDGLAQQLLRSPGAGMFTHGTTWGGHPVSTAVGIANLTAMRDEDVLGNVSRLESHFQAGLSDIRRAHPTVLEWRGSGYLYVVEFTADRQNGRALTDEQAETIVREVIPTAMKREKLMTRSDDRGGTLLVLSPPLISDRDVIDELLHAADAVASAVDEYVGP